MIDAHDSVTGLAEFLASEGDRLADTSGFNVDHAQRASAYARTLLKVDGIFGHLLSPLLAFRSLIGYR